MGEVDELPGAPEYRATMERLQQAKKVSATGVDYWQARDIFEVLGYERWENFQEAIRRAMSACEVMKVTPHTHFRETTKLVKLGSDAQRKVLDYWLTRTACYLVAMNGDPTKPEIAAAQAYFAVQTRRMEKLDQATEDERRIELRERVRTSVRKVSGVAKDAGVRNTMQPIFHDARYQGLYGMPLRKVKQKKGLGADEQLLDRAGAMELSANDFQMSLAADVIKREDIKGETEAINVNRQVGGRVRDVISESKGTMPEDLPLEPPIAEVKRRLIAKKKELK